MTTHQRAYESERRARLHAEGVDCPKCNGRAQKCSWCSERGLVLPHERDEYFRWGYRGGVHG